VLPLTSGSKKIAVLGSACDAPQDVDAQLKQWDLGSYYNIGGSGRVIAWNPVSILAGISSKCKERGCEVVSAVTDNSSEAIKAAEGADVAIICGATSSTEGHDRASLSVDQEDFLVKVAAGLFPSVPVVSLTITPGAIVMPWVEHTSAVVNLFMAGKYTGNAFADAVFGDSNPSAKLPVTFPMSEADTVAPCAETECPYTEGVFVGWRGLQDKDVLFPFGHGLSYTSFSYSELELSTVAQGAGAMSGCAGSVVCIKVRIANTGSISGVEIAQMYMGFPDGVGEPAMVLRGFARSAVLEPGAFVDVAFPLKTRDLQIYLSQANGWVMPNGDFKVFIGASSRDLRLTSGFSACSGVASLQMNQPCR